jgi:hypothetical protein
MGITAHPWAMMAALGPPRFALQPLGCHHGPWAGGKTHDPSGGVGVMYHNYTAEQKLLHKRRARKSYDIPLQIHCYPQQASQRVTMVEHKSIVTRYRPPSGLQWYYISPLLPAASLGAGNNGTS